MKAFAFLCCVLIYHSNSVTAVSFNDLIAEEWELFKTQFSKAYNTEIEEKFRMKVFMDNKHKIARHNKLFQNGEVSYELEMNHFGDLLHHEFVKTVNGYRHSLRRVTGDEIDSVTFIPAYNVTVPDSVDWRTEGAVTEVKNQGQCGSCWAFSTTGSLEGQHFRNTKQLTSLSEQNLIDCSGKYGNNGCSGGLMDNAFAYIKSNKGIDTEQSYPYEGIDDKCRYKPQESGATDKGFVDIPQGDEEKLKLAVATVGPISVAIDASHQSFQFYKKGVYYDKGCGNGEEDLDHGVLAVGYGTENGKDYWLVKNSWGKRWGLDGYIKMARNKHNHCGIATSASYPLV
uniref:Putative cathepsin L-like protease n=1 Tax=Maconellicoccus hirsutus TaxID=177089 RepID=A2I408_MACHI|nr:putative cathepsin L-like protease [Maconellicoccus hirsutus]